MAEHQYLSTVTREMQIDFGKDGEVLSYELADSKTSDDLIDRVQNIKTSSFKASLRSNFSQEDSGN
jgi:hypothetical protein